MTALPESDCHRAVREGDQWEGEKWGKTKELDVSPQLADVLLERRVRIRCWEDFF